MKVALVYDRVNKFGGAEQVLLNLHQIWPSAPLYTSVYNPPTANWADSFQVIPSYLNHIPFAKTRHQWLAWATPMAFESFDFSSFDVVISVTSAEAKGIITPPSTLHLSYILTPTRYLWSHTQLYQTNSHLTTKNPLTRSLTRHLLKRLRAWDQIAASRPDKIAAISQTVATRIRKYYHRKTDAIIYPPVTLVPSAKSKPHHPFFLIVSRLVPYKRVDLAIKAFNQLNLPLVVVGQGMQKSYLSKIAGQSVTIAGTLSQTKLNNLYRNCQALIFPSEDDFGITPLEAQSAGKPVIAFGRGGATETVIPGKTGLFFKTQSTKSIIRALAKFNPKNFKSINCKNQAKKFSPQTFKTKFKNLVEQSWQQHQNQYQ